MHPAGAGPGFDKGRPRSRPDVVDGGEESRRNLDQSPYSSPAWRPTCGRTIRHSHRSFSNVRSRSGKTTCSRPGRWLAGLTVSNSAVLTGIVSRAAGRQGRLELTMPEATDLLLLRHRYQSSSRRVADEWLLMRFPPEVRWSVPAGDGVSVVEALTFNRLSPLPEFLPPRSQRPSE